MNTAVSAARTLFIVRVPHQPASVHYRAYAERLQDGSVLDWVLSRFHAAVPPEVPVACVCESEAERRFLKATYGLPRDVQFLSVVGRGESHQCRLLMNEHQVQRLIVARLSHAILPLAIVRDLIGFHNALHADLTDFAPPPPGMPLYAIESRMVDRLLGAVLPNVPAGVIAAALLLRQARQRDPGLVSEFCWPRVEVAKQYGIDARRWPESLDLESARDVAILKDALSRAATGGHSGDHYVDSIKHSAISIGQQRCANGSTARRVPGRSHRRTRILYASSLSDFVGAAQSLCHLIGALDRQRFEPFALVSFEGTFSEELRRRGVHVICPNERIGLPKLRDVDFALGVLQDHAPDLVHANLGIGVPLTHAVIASGIPLVQHVRIPVVTGYGLQIHAASAVIAVSRFVRDRILELDVDPHKIEVIWNGVDVETFRPAPLERPAARERLAIPPGEFVVALIARMNRSKRHDTVIKAVGRLRRAIGRGHLLFVGALDGDRGYRQQIGSWIEKEQLVGHASMIEFTPDVRTILYASDLLALMSKDEPLSRAVLEAMAVGLPIVISDSGGTPEVINSGRDGFVVPYGSSDALAAVLMELALEPDRARRVGAAAVATIRGSLTAAHCAEKTMRLYERLLSERQGTRGEFGSLAGQEAPTPN